VGDGEWRNYTLENGREVVVRRGSPVDAAFELAADSGKSGPGLAMQWSLGALGDLLWMRLPEARPLLAKRIERAVEDSIESDSELRTLTVGEIVTEVLGPVLMSTLAAHPEKQTELTGQLNVVKDAYRLESWDHDTIRYMLDAFTFELLRTPQHRSIVAELDPELAGLIRRLG
jgi:hypothetical protein